jgi:hypothetical protein
VANCYGHGNETSVSVKGGEFLDQLNDHKLLKEGTLFHGVTSF